MAIIEYWPSEDPSYPFGTCMYGSDNYFTPKGVHVMNKNEAKVMRKLQVQTGLSEEEIREVKKYRVMLSEAQKEDQKAKRSRFQKEKDRVMKKVTKELKLAKEHPKVQEAFKVVWTEYLNKNPNMKSRVRLGWYK